MYSLLLAVIYLSFISLGLPDALLGSAWPTMYLEFGVPVSYAGIVSTVISAGTVVSAFFSDRVTRALGPGRVTAISVGVTALALAGFSWSRSYWPLLLWAVPYGLGAGSVDAALNNYVALHYKSRHMSWLHCMWGIGASLGPYIMGWALSGGRGWPAGYQAVALLQAGLTAILFVTLPLWKKRAAPGADPGEAAPAAPISKAKLISLPGAKAMLLSFLCYQAVEATAGLWASSYLVMHRGLGEAEAANFASLFYLGITAGRALGGFLTMKLRDDDMIRLGQGVLLCGLVLVILPLGTGWTLAGLVLAGLGCAPIYPAIIHSTPEHFGPGLSQSMIGLEMSCAYIGNIAAPPLFGLIANHVDVALLPWYLLGITLVMAVSHETVVRRCRR